MAIETSDITALNEYLARALYDSFWRLTNGVGIPGAFQLPQEFDDLTIEQQGVFTSMSVRAYNDQRVKNYWACRAEEQLEDCAEWQD